MKTPTDEGQLEEVAKVAYRGYREAFPGPLPVWGDLPAVEVAAWVDSMSEALFAWADMQETQGGD